MEDIELKIDLEDLMSQIKIITNELVKDVQGSIGALAVATQKHIKEEAQNKLHSFREKYLESLSEAEQVDKNLWVITLSADASWIETGIPKDWDMKPGLLNNKNAKGPIKSTVGKDGKKYRIIPMNQGQTPTQLASGRDTLDMNGKSVGNGHQQNMIDLVKYTLKKKGIPYKKLEVDGDNKPRLGKLHSLDISSPIPGKGNTEQLKGLNIYQTKQKDGSVKRTLTTFRTVKEGDDGKWIHPPVAAANFFKHAKEFAEREWEEKIMPAILEKYK